MKEVFLLPTIGETLFQPQIKQAEKPPSLFEEERSFREVLEQAKSAPEKPLAKHRNDHPDRVHREETKPLPQSEEPEPQVQPQDPTSSAEETDQIQMVADPLAFADPPTVILTAVDPTLTFNLGSEDTVQLQDEVETAVLEGVGEATRQASGDLALIDSLSQEKKQAEVSQNSLADKTFPQLIQAQGELSPALEEIEKGAQTSLQPEASIKPEPQSSTEETQSKAVSVPATDAKESNKAASGEALQVAGEQRPGAGSANAQEMAGENTRTDGSETQPASIKEGARPEAVQTSGPPSSSPAAKPMEPARLAEAHRTEVVQQVARELEVFGKSGQTSLRIQLYPEQLGRIDVRLISRADGVQIVMHAENASTASLLERDLNFLRESLVQAGVNLSGLTVGQGQAQGRSDLSQSQFRSPQQNAWKFGEAADHGDPSAKSSAQRWRDSSSTFDYRI